jgi:ATP-binding cassette subfamily F protein uup
MTWLALEGVSKARGERVLLRGVDLVLEGDERVGLVGPNGCGKSTLLRILAGLEPVDEGVRRAARDLRLGYLEQEPTLTPGRTLRDEVRAALEGRAEVMGELEAVHEALASASEPELARLLARQARLEEALERLGGHDVEHRIDALLQELGLPDGEAPCDRLSGGERRRVALARLLLARPDFLLLDEPTNHLDAFVIDWLEDWFLETRIPLLLVTHDRYFLDRVCDRIVELDRGRLYTTPGGYAEFLGARAARLEAEQRAESSRLNLLRRETAWMRRGPPARTTKAKARIRRFEDLAAADPGPSAAELAFRFPDGPRLGSRVVTLKGVTRAFDGRVVVPPIDLELAAGERVGVVGPNGAGKTTLLRIVLGHEPPDRGTVEVGETVRFAGIDQMRADVDASASLRSALAGRGDLVRVDGRSVRVEAYLDRFGFTPNQQQAPVGMLSGGERNRFLLARLLCDEGNVLVLDEPTNDLDLDTLRALEEALLAFPGTVLCVSHDRWFLDRVATRVVCLDGEGGVRLHHGSMDELLEGLAQERARRRSEANRTSRPPAVSTPPPPPRRKGLAPWERRELDELEARIGALEEELTTVDARLAEPALYTGPREQVEELNARRAGLAEELGRHYERWTELEERA